MWTRKSVLILATGVVCLVGGMIFNNLQLLLMGSVFLFILVLAYFITISSVEVKRIIPESRAFEGDRITVILRIINTGHGSGLLEVFDKLPSAFRLVEGSNGITVSLGRDEMVDLEYVVECPLRGYYLVGPVIVRKRDFFQIFCDKVTINAQSHMTIYPRMDPLKDVHARTRYRKMHPGSVSLKEVGTGSDFHSIRDYMSTDPFKRINWKVTSRLRRLMVNQYELEDVFNAMILVDARSITKVGTPLRNPLEFSIKAAAAISDALMKRTNKVGVVTYNDNVRVVPPGSGETQLYTILSHLTGTYAKGSRSFKDALVVAGRYITPRSPIILISPLDDDPSVKEMVRDLCSRDFHVSIVSPSSVEFEREVTGVYSPKYLLLRMERENFMTTLRGYGARVIDWTPDRSIDSIVREVRGH